MENKTADNPPPPAERPEALYATLVQIRNPELAAHWLRYNIQFAVNFGLLAAVAMKARDSFVAAHLHCIAIIGVDLALIWFFLAAQSMKTIKSRWEKRLQIYEDMIARPEDRLFQRLAEEDSKKSWFVRNWQNLNLLAWGLPSLCLFAWVLLFISKSIAGGI